MGMGSMIIHSLLNTLLVQKSNIQKNSSWNLGLSPTTIIWKPLIQDWLLNVLIVMASKVEAKNQSSHYKFPIHGFMNLLLKLTSPWMIHWVKAPFLLVKIILKMIWFWETQEQLGSKTWFQWCTIFDNNCWFVT
jgi:hypothetical protein